MPPTAKSCYSMGTSWSCGRTPATKTFWWAIGCAGAKHLSHGGLLIPTNPPLWMIISRGRGGGCCTKGRNWRPWPIFPLCTANSASACWLWPAPLPITPSTLKMCVGGCNSLNWSPWCWIMFSYTPRPPKSWPNAKKSSAPSTNSTK